MVIKARLAPSATAAVAPPGPVGGVAASAISRRVGAPLMTRHFTLSEALKAYDTFGNAMRERALKIIITND